MVLKIKNGKKWVNAMPVNMVSGLKYAWNSIMLKRNAHIYVQYHCIISHSTVYTLK